MTDAGMAMKSFSREDAGGTARKMPKNPQRESNLRDGDPISFSSDAVPDWNPRGHGISYRPDDGTWMGGTFDATAPQAQRFQLEGVSASSATVRAQLQQVGTTTDRTDNFGGGNFAETDTSDSPALSNLPAVNNEFEVGVYYHFETEAAQNVGDISGSWEATLEIYGVDGATGQETLRASDTFTGFAGFNETDDGYRWNVGTFPELADDGSDFIRIKFADLHRTSGDIVFRSFPDTYMDGVNEAQSRDTEHGIRWQTASIVTADMTSDDVHVAFNILDPS